MTRCMWPNGGFTAPKNYKTTSTGFRYTSPFGLRTHPVTGAPTTMHYGIDLIGWVTIKSPVNGVVTFSGYNGGAGYEVRIKEDGTGDVFRELHNSRLLVRGGQRVRQGQDVAIMGTTGSSTGIHNHHEVRPGGGAAVEPLAYYNRRNPSAPATIKEIKVKTLSIQDARAKAGKITLSPGQAFYLDADPKAGPSNADNVSAGVGANSFTPHIYAEGAPGDMVLLRLMWQTNPGTSQAQNSYHYEEEIEIGKNGRIRTSREFKRGVAKGQAVYVHVQAMAGNAKPIKVTRLDCDAYQFAVV